MGNNYTQMNFQYFHGQTSAKDVDKELDHFFEAMGRLSNNKKLYHSIVQFSLVLCKYITAAGFLYTLVLIGTIFFPITFLEIKKVFNLFLPFLVQPEFS
jgi:hypothetical protein